MIRVLRASALGCIGALEVTCAAVVLFRGDKAQALVFFVASAWAFAAAATVGEWSTWLIRAWRGKRGDIWRIGMGALAAFTGATILGRDLLVSSPLLLAGGIAPVVALILAARVGELPTPKRRAPRWAALSAWALLILLFAVAIALGEPGEGMRETVLILLPLWLAWVCLRLRFPG